MVNCAAAVSGRPPFDAGVAGAGAADADAAPTDAEAAEMIGTAAAARKRDRRERLFSTVASWPGLLAPR